MTLPFSAAADRNKEVIGDALEPFLKDGHTVLEIGSGTAQHIVYLAERFSHVRWQPSDKAESIRGIKDRIASAGCTNIEPPLVLDVADPFDLNAQYDIAFSANTAHIMSISEVARMFALLAGCIKPNAYFALYGPFKYSGAHTAPSNESFDAMLQQQAPHMGIRDKAELDALAFEKGFDFAEDLEMPANNRMLLWRR